MVAAAEKNLFFKDFINLTDQQIGLFLIFHFVYFAMCLLIIIYGTKNKSKLEDS
jgi:hypothetical protein